MDALRAKRAMEAAERTARQKEQAEKDKHEQMNADLKEARLQQQAEKERRLGEQAKFERDEFERIIEVQMQQEEAERQRQAEEHQLRLQHAQDTDPPAKLEVPGEKPVDSANAPATKTPADTVEGGPASSKTSSGSSCIQSQGNEEKDPERRPSRMQEAWKKSQESEKPRRASQMLGTTYSKLVTRVEIDIKESVPWTL
eukprot:g14749.t1